jgi:hypothetical protein
MGIPHCPPTTMNRLQADLASIDQLTRGKDHLPGKMAMAAVLLSVWAYVAHQTDQANQAESSASRAKPGEASIDGPLGRYRIGSDALPACRSSTCTVPMRTIELLDPPAGSAAPRFRVPSGALVAGVAGPQVWLVWQGLAIPLQVDVIEREAESALLQPSHTVLTRNLPIAATDWRQMPGQARARAFARSASGTGRLFEAGDRLITQPGPALRAGLGVRSADEPG